MKINYWKSLFEGSLVRMLLKQYIILDYLTSYLQLIDRATDHEFYDFFNCSVKTFIKLSSEILLMFLALMPFQMPKLSELKNYLANFISINGCVLIYEVQNIAMAFNSGQQEFPHGTYLKLKLCFCNTSALTVSSFHSSDPSQQSHMPSLMREEGK